jgi:hypothetical protein
VVIWRPSDLENVDASKQVARIAHTVGEKKRVLIIEEAKKKSIRILNPGLKKAPELEAVPETPSEAVPAESAPEAKEEAAISDVGKETTAKKRRRRKSTK